MAHWRALWIRVKQTEQLFQIGPDMTTLHSGNVQGRRAERTIEAKYIKKKHRNIFIIFMRSEILLKCRDHETGTRRDGEKNLKHVN